MPAWFEEEDFWANFAPVMFDGRRWAEVPAVVDGIDARLAEAGGPRLRPGLRVYDSCCGPGRHALELARRGCRVTAVDITEAYLDAARESARAEGLDIEFLREDVRDFERHEAFDLALNLFTSFGYFDTKEEDLAFLGRLRRSLRPGGVLVVDVLGKECAVRDFLESEWFEREGRIACSEYSVEGPWEYLVNHWIVIAEGRIFERRWRQRLYSAVELGEALRAAGFDGNIGFFGNTAGIPYDSEAWSLVAVAATGGGGCNSARH